jgi:2-amino-4-hydroxy-6-hydroxymethyldihydropteridine diphosphokinase
MLTYGDKALKTDNYTLPRDEITKYAFVLKPLADIAPDEIYPPENQTYLNLWQGFDATGQDMKVVDFIWE